MDQFESSHQTGNPGIVQDLHSDNEVVERLKVWVAETASCRLDAIYQDTFARILDTLDVAGLLPVPLVKRQANIAPQSATFGSDWPKLAQKAPIL